MGRADCGQKITCIIMYFVGVSAACCSIENFTTMFASGQTDLSQNQTTEYFSLSNSVLMGLDASAGVGDRLTCPLLRDAKLACQVSTGGRSNRKVKRGKKEKEMKAGVGSIPSR